MSSVPAYSIRADAIAREKERVGGDLAKFDVANVIALDTLELRPVGPKDVHLRILAVSAEHNIDHASTADTVQHRRRAAAARSTRATRPPARCSRSARCVTKFQPGDIVITHCNGGPDEYGFPTRIWAYDADDSIGWYAKEAVVGDWQVIRAPLDCGLSLWEIAAHAAARADRVPPVAARARHLSAQGALREARAPERARLRRRRLGAVPPAGEVRGARRVLLLRAAPSGARRSRSSASSASTRSSSTASRAATTCRPSRTHCRKLTGGEQMHLVCDMLRGPVFAAGLAVAAREGVNVSAGWQLSQVVEYNSTLMSVKQVTIDHTHYETLEGCAAATALYGTRVQAHGAQGDLRRGRTCRARTRRCTRTRRRASRSSAWPTACPTP